MVGRNELCPCGSGRKYKKCCLEKDRAKDIARNIVNFGKSQFESIIQKIVEFSGKEFENYKKKFEVDFGISNYELENLMNVYYLANYKYNKQTSIMLDYFNRNKQSLNSNDADIIENTLSSYMSIYQVKEKDINKILLRDILLSDDVYVEDIDLFSSFEAGDFLLARIISVGSAKIFLDKTIKIDEGRKAKIKSTIDMRYKQTKKKFKTKKQFLLNNIKFMYENLIQVRREDIAENMHDVAKNNTNIESKEKTIQNIKESNIISITSGVTKPISQKGNILKEILLPVIQKSDKNKEEIKLLMELQNEEKPKEETMLKIVKSIDEGYKKENVTEIEQPMIQQIEKETSEKSREIKAEKVESSDTQEEQKNIFEIKKRERVMARKSKDLEGFKTRKRKNRRLEDKLKQRLKITREIEGRKAALELIRQEKLIKEREEKLRERELQLEQKLLKESAEEPLTQMEKENVNQDKVTTISSYKTKQIESKIENISISKIEPIESKIENNIVAKMMVQSEEQVDENQEQCKIYDMLISKVEDQYKNKCIDAWRQFKKIHKSYKGSENSWAAAIEYYVKKTIDETVTQGQISKKYNISVKTLSKRYRELQIT